MADPAQEQSWFRRTAARQLSRLGPGVITGAADDDPSGIATYSQAGAQFGYAPLWTVFLTTPLMIAVQVLSARIGAASGIGLIGNLRRHHGRRFLGWLVLLLFGANVFNIAADVAAMGEALRLVAGGPEFGHSVLLAALILALQLFVPYRRYAKLLKWSTLVLFVYVAAVLTLAVPWAEVISALVVPRLELTSSYALIVVAVLGTTISPYLLFWQASQEAEERQLVLAGKLSRPDRDRSRRITIDTTLGMLFSNGIALCIMVTAAGALHAHGVDDIQTADQAAEALRPIAGDLTFALFAAGIIGTGLLAVPVLSGSAAYAVAELLDWRSSLEEMPWRARGFYGAICLAMGIGIALDYFDANPIKMLVASAVTNGIIAVPMMVLLMRLARDPVAVGFPLPGSLLKLLGWTATCLMAGVVLALAWTVVN